VNPEQFRDFYATLFSDNTPITEQQSDKVIECKELDDDFDFTELNKGLKLLSLKKAAGPDQIVNEAWRSLHTQQRLVLLDLINKTWRENRIESQLLETVIVPIYKKGDRKDPGNYRPISLVNTFTKILTSLMTQRLNTWCEKNSKISMFQAAYRKGMGCESHVFALNSILQSNLQKKGGKVYALFIDLTKAFDSINHEKLWKRLSEIGVSSKFVNFIKVLYSNLKTKVRTNRGESSFFKFKKGVMQGESLSPKLFTLYIEKLVELLHSSDIPGLTIGKILVHLLLYADDIVLLATNAIDLQEKN